MIYRRYKLCAALAIVLLPFLVTSCAINTQHSFETYTADTRMEYDRYLHYKRMDDKVQTEQIVTTMQEEQKKQETKKAKKR